MIVKGWTDKKLKAFENWLKTRGAEWLPTTNQYEAIRFKAKEIGVLYTSGNTNSIYTYKAIECYRTGSKWDGRPKKVNRTGAVTGRKRKQDLLNRDGDRCFYCDEPLGDDITVEHLFSVNRGGPNYLSNTVLAHDNCNKEVGSMTVVDKVKYAIKNRTK